MILVHILRGLRVFSILVFDFRFCQQYNDGGFSDFSVQLILRNNITLTRLVQVE